MQKIGFGNRWRRWMREYISTTQVSVLVNSVLTAPFHMKKGLRQRCPLSPFLFNMVVKVLSRLMYKAKEKDIFENIKIESNGLAVSHLQFANDTLVFCQPKGLKINFMKNSIIGVGVREKELASWADSIACKVGSISNVYLRLPLGACNRSMKTWRPIIKKFKDRLVGWKSKMLSMGGRVTLLKSVMASLPLFYMSLF
ncbi:Reverse transcriptase domain - like 10 [Theobroma cacao]|nr:Reverse transcriptase domain - like 10 [Theobroma cacao]